MHIYVKKSYRKENYKIVFPHELKKNALVFFPSRFLFLFYFCCVKTPSMLKVEIPYLPLQVEKMR